MQLPECFHRGGEISAGRWSCNHPGLMASQGVSAEDCVRCAANGIFCNKKPADIHLTAPTPQPAAETIYRCSYRGKETGESVQCKSCGGGVRLKLHSCGFPGLELCVINPHGLPLHESETKKLVANCATCQVRQEIPVRHVILRDACCPGDIAVLTAALRELHMQYPGRFKTAVDTPCPGLWESSPHISTDIKDAEIANIHYDSEVRFPARDVHATINKSSQRPIHMLDAYCEGIACALDLPGLRPRHWLEPSIWLSDGEKRWVSQVQETTGKPTRYWLVNAGTKTDYTCKLWPFYQEVINRTKHLINWVQIGATKDIHQPLDGTLMNLTGKTDLRQLVRLVYHAQGVMCGVTALMHLAHWVERPAHTPFRRHAVIIGGGRESPHWYSYPGHQIYHTIGELDCCASGGCWKARIEPLSVDPEKNHSLCAHPRKLDSGHAPLCMTMIDPAIVAAQVLRLASL